MSAEGAVSGNNAEEESKPGPSVDSTDKEERIAARRIRIQKRIEAQRRAKLGEDPDIEKELNEEASKSWKQMEESRLRLTKLRDDGFELVTNIRVAGDSREGLRRLEEEEAKRQRREKLEAEAKAGAERFEEITKKWESALQKEIPQDLFEMLMQQKAACDAMIYEKNKLINDFQGELKQKDDRYVKDLKKQGEDIDLLIERMDEQVKQLTKAYRQELDEIERAFVAERTELLESNRKKWENGMQGRNDKEVEYMQNRQKRVDDYEKQLQQLRIQDAEEYNSIKIQLETDVQILEQQLQQMRATYQLNQEKLEYNFQVLRKRDEENTITKSQQKRKITRLQDVNTNLRIKLAKQEKQYKDENQQLTEDYKRITEQFKELQKKSKDSHGHFISTDTKKFQEVWLMNEEEVKEMMYNALEADKIITEQQLGLKWEQPDISFSDNAGPLSEDKDKGEVASAQQVLHEVLTPDAARSDSASEDGAPINLLKKFSPRLIKMILELLCNENGFLVEEKLKKLLAPLEKDEQNLMRLDAIFTALGVETEDDIHVLTNYMVTEKTQPESAPSSQRQYTEQGVGPGGTEQEGEKLEFDETAADKEVEDTLAGNNADQVALVHPNEVLKALRAYVEENKEQAKFYIRNEYIMLIIKYLLGLKHFPHLRLKEHSERITEIEYWPDLREGSSDILMPPRVKEQKQLKEKAKNDERNKFIDWLFETEKGRSGQFMIAALDDRDDSRDAAYWESYPGVINLEKEKLRDALIHGLEQYNDVLGERTSLLGETDALRQQNAELRMLLHQYVNSKVNQELEVPPTRVLQMELNPPSSSYY